jgi:sigma-B regulation protein RsbU (phosphoserine phosphatase)
VAASGSSPDAVRLAADFKPDLAILDIRMPGLDGFELMARLKMLQPGLDVILMTGSLEDQDEKLVRAIRGRAFYFIQKPFDREVLRTLVERCLELRWHRESNRRHVQRLETELAEARAFQQSLLPPPEAEVAGLAVCCRCAPCSELGGDLYDYAVDSTGRAALIVADVVGHGASAAMLTGIVKSAFRAAHADGYDPLSVVERVWTGVAAFGFERFVTLVAAVASPDGRLAFVNAGHPPGLLWNASGISPLDGTGPLVSPALSAPRWDRVVVPFARGDRLLLYTDGVSEALAGDEGEGEERLRELIARHTGGGPPLVDAILDEVRRVRGRDPHQDDLTLLTASVGS